MSVAERREREKKERRDSIVAAARRVFFAKGVGPSTMDDVAQEAQLSKGTLYLYFKSKDDLYLELVIAQLAQRRTRHEKLGAGASTGYEAFVACVRDQFDFVKREPEEFRAMVGWLNGEFDIDEAAPAFAEFRQAHTELMRGIHDIIARGVSDGSIRSDREPQRLAFVLWSSSVGVLMAYNNRDALTRRVTGAMDFDGLLSDFVDIVLSSIRGSVEGAS